MNLLALEYDYKKNQQVDLQTNDCDCSNKKCQQMRQELLFYSKLLDNDTSFQPQQNLKVFNSPGKSSQLSNFDSKNVLLLGTNGNEMIDLNFISNGSFQQLDNSSLHNYKDMLKKSSSIPSIDLKNISKYEIKIHDLNIENKVNSNLEYNSINDFNRKRHELETSI